MSSCFQRNSELCGRAEMGGTEPTPRGSRAVLPAWLSRSLPVASTTYLGAGAPGPPSGQGRPRGRTRGAPPGRGLGSSVNGSFGGKTGSPRWRCPSLTETWSRWLEDFSSVSHSVTLQRKRQKAAVLDTALVLEGNRDQGTGTRPELGATGGTGQDAQAEPAPAHLRRPWSSSCVRCLSASLAPLRRTGDCGSAVPQRLPARPNRAGSWWPAAQPVCLTRLPPQYWWVHITHIITHIPQAVKTEASKH